LREILGSGHWYGLKVLPEAYLGNGLAMLAPGAFIIVGLLIWTQRTIIKKYEDA
jgi:Na+-transporting NADH:ubiquinone oxidoreductase subunit D